MLKARQNFEVDLSKHDLGKKIVVLKEGCNVLKSLTDSGIKLVDAQKLVILYAQAIPELFHLTYENTKPVFSKEHQKELGMSTKKRIGSEDKVDLKKLSKFKDKKKLDDWAKKYGINLDRRQSLEGMKEEFETKI